MFIDPWKGTRVVAAVKVPDSLLALWAGKERKQLITHLELFPILVGLHRLAPHLSGGKLLLFVDNNGVRDSVIKGSSKVDDVFAMLSGISMVLNTFGISLWTTRIPSKSNPADWPSRDRAEEAARLLGFTLEKPWEAPQELVNALLQARSFLDYMCSFGKEGVM